MASIEVKQISSLCKTHMQCHACYRFRVRKIGKNTPIGVCVYIRSAHDVLHVCMTWKWATHVCSKNLWTPATISWRLFAHFHSRKRVACKGLQHARMNISAGPWRTRYSLAFSCACFRIVKAGRILVPAPASEHRGQGYDRSHTHASLLRDACALIMIPKR